MGKQRSRRVAFAALAAALILLLLAISASGYINYITVQGKLKNGSGSAYLSGDYGMVFKIYASENAVTPLYTESHTGANAVTVKDGFFSASLGTITPLDLNFLQNYWLGITVGADSEMSPRQPFIPQPYSMSSQVALDVTCSSCAGDAEIANALTIITPNDVNILGRANIYDLNIGRTISAGGARGTSAGDLNIGSYLHLAKTSKCIIGRNSASLSSPMHLWLSAPETLSRNSIPPGANVFETSVEATSDANLYFAFPVPHGELGSSAILDSITIQYYGATATDYIDSVYIERINTGTSLSLTPVMSYHPNITSGTSKTITSADTPNLPLTLASGTPYLITVGVDVSPATPQPVTIHGFKLEYHLG
ncbi:MAG: hypothetical protein V1676_01215 [Candidatus Diapherotrites archaeon]